MEYLLGPVVALLIALKFTHYQSDLQSQKVKELDDRIEFVEDQLINSQADSEKREEEISKKVMATIMPVAKAVNKLNQTVGI
tara:strand:+ start:246 stop:491 length:246 start_codon:yes stop_codon:yes gene_type:complete